MKNIKCLNNFVIVKIESSKHDEKSAGGIILSSKQVEDPINYGTVASVGEGINEKLKNDVVVGAKIAFPKNVQYIDAERTTALIQDYQIYGITE